MPDSTTEIPPGCAPDEDRPSPLERFEVEEEVGQGAAGIVFRARDKMDGSLCALKVIASSDADEEARVRFLDEGQLLSDLHHPGIVRILDFGVLADRHVELGGRVFMPGTPYIAMEWLQGKDLQQRAAASPLSLPDSLRCARLVSEALGAAHGQGIVHRDVKPSNVIVLDADGESDGEPMRVKLVDFGVACDAGSLTTLGPMVGTPSYMAPEQARGDMVLDPRCDVYSLGATLFELIAGRPPHVGPTPIAIVAKLVSTPAQRLSELVVDVPDALDDLVADMLSLEYAGRPFTEEVSQRLDALLADPALPKLASTIERQQESVHSSVSRLVTTLVALHVATGEERDALLRRMREEGAEAVRLGKDSVVAFLGARRAHGGEANLAIELGQRLTHRGARIGIATGRAAVDLARPVGEVVDKASALAREAPAGKLFTDEVTVELARASFDFAKGPASAWEVRGKLPERRRAADQTPFVGRDSEMTQLFDAYERCLDSRAPVVVSISGPPGIGKSRLGREFVQRLDEYRHSAPPVTEPSAGADGSAVAPRVEPRTRLVLARCEAYGRSRALGTAADALVDLLQIPKGARIEEIEAALEPLQLVYEESGLLARLLAGEPFGAEVDPVRARDILYLAMTELTLKVIEDTPCVMVLEDLQWSDPESVAWFDHLLSRAVGKSLYVLVLARPGFWRDEPGRFQERDHVRVELRPVPRRATMEIARAVMGCEAGDPKLMEIAKQAAGSPLFAEELARVIASGKEASTVPTIEAAIQVSLDGLEDDAHEALVKMSVFGLSAWEAGLT
ncbi:MAG TPA: serine/threonine-protein kinase PknK, partial [Polyangiaceae bacterium]|nr:serine/threonine-protein kinase PknK [Polyangiaceae bacterium]